VQLSKSEVLEVYISRYVAVWIYNRR